MPARAFPTATRTLTSAHASCPLAREKLGEDVQLFSPSAIKMPTRCLLARLSTSREQDREVNGFRNTLQKETPESTRAPVALRRCARMAPNSDRYQVLDDCWNYMGLALTNESPYLRLITGHQGTHGRLTVEHHFDVGALPHSYCQCIDRILDIHKEFTPLRGLFMTAEIRGLPATGSG
jgi:hypothetical protein